MLLNVCVVAVQPPGGNLGWAEEFQNVRGAADWANEFGQAQVQPGELQARDAAGTSDAMQQTRALRDTLASSSNPKFRHSKFLQFVSKMSRGEIILEDNQVRSTVDAENARLAERDFMSVRTRVDRTQLRNP